jgi:hypothetical protein
MPATPTPTLIPIRRPFISQFLIIIVVDGREKMNKTMQEYFEKDLKVWDSDMVMMEHRNNAVTCHLFEKTVDLPKHSSQREYFKPLQIALAVKEKNGGKLNSHLWFFSAFVKQLQPDFCVVRRTAPHPSAPCTRELGRCQAVCHCAYTVGARCAGVARATGERKL